MDCLFCKIVQKKIPAETVFEDDDTLAFLDIHPVAPGHTLVIPKEHAETVIALSDRGTSALFLTVKRITATLEKALLPNGFTIGINHGRVAGQLVDHVHVHIIPRFADDGGGSVHTIVSNPPQESLRAIVRKLKSVAV